MSALNCTTINHYSLQSERYSQTYLFQYQIERIAESLISIHEASVNEFIHEIEKYWHVKTYLFSIMEMSRWIVGRFLKCIFMLQTHPDMSVNCTQQEREYFHHIHIWTLPNRHVRKGSICKHFVVKILQILSKWYIIQASTTVMWNMYVNVLWIYVYNIYLCVYIYIYFMDEFIYRYIYWYILTEYNKQLTLSPNKYDSK